MSDYRIEITFRGPAPAGELERAKILGGAKVIAAIEALRDELNSAGIATEVAAASIKSSEARRKVKPRLAVAAE